MIRSWLYVPGDRPDRFDKAAESGADAIILDLEDAVAIANKPAAREAVPTWVQSANVASQIWIRVNSDPQNLMADLRAVNTVPAAGLILAKASVSSLRRLNEQLPASGVLVGALIETAEGLLDAREIAAHNRVVRLSVGEADLGADMAIDPSPDEREWWPHRASVIQASAAATIDAPCGPVSTDFYDLDALAASTEALRRFGFGSRSAIHPDQVATINRVFTPSAESVEAAQRIVALYDASVAAGSGVLVDDNGRMVDEAVVRTARRTIALAELA